MAVFWDKLKKCGNGLKDTLTEHSSTMLRIHFKILIINMFIK